MTSAPTPDAGSLAEVKAAYARRADAVTYAFEYGNDLARLRAVWQLWIHHGLAATWPVLWDGFRRAVDAGPHITWHHPPRRTSDSNEGR